MVCFRMLTKNDWKFTPDIFEEELRSLWIDTRATITLEPVKVLGGVEPEQKFAVEL